MKEQIMNSVTAILDKWERDRAIFNFAFNLAGPSNKNRRQAILLELTGKTYPKAQAGVHEIERVIREMADQQLTT
jgi:hypothetical protein